MKALSNSLDLGIEVVTVNHYRKKLDLVPLSAMDDEDLVEIYRRSKGKNRKELINEILSRDTMKEIVYSCFEAFRPYPVSSKADVLYKEIVKIAKANKVKRVVALLKSGLTVVPKR